MMRYVVHGGDGRAVVPGADMGRALDFDGAAATPD
jgi:hypothetical protein